MPTEITVTDKAIDHETMRFSYMTDKQLLARLYKITSPKKLEAFRQVAEIWDKKELAALAEEKRDFMLH